MHIALISFLTNSIGTRSLSSYLKSNGYQCSCLFCPLDFNETNLASLFSLLKKLDISLVGLSAVTDDFGAAVTVTDKLKQLSDIPIIWGGAHVNVCPDESLQHADMICLGEGEDAFLALVQSIAKNGKPDTKVKNIWYKSDDGIIKNELMPLEENLDKYPVPDFDLDTMYVMNEHSFENMNEAHINYEYAIMTSRGCPYNCSYCYNSYRRSQYKGKGRYLRCRSIENVIEELLAAKKTFKNLKKINFMDDSFIARKMDDFFTFKDQYLKKIRLPFYALAEPMAFDFDKVRLLKECGLNDLQVGIQSGSERINHEIYKRKISNEKVLRISQFINSLEINVVYDLIFNNPYETHQDLLETINLLMKFPEPFSIQGYNLIYYPKSELTERALNDSHILVKDYRDDFSTIEGKEDSPINLRGKSKISSRFYKVNYSSREKDYYNSIISLMAYNHVPRMIIRFFLISNKPFMFFLLNIFNKFYDIAHRIRHFLASRLGT